MKTSFVYDIGSRAELLERKPGDTISFWYPVRNRMFLPLEHVRREIRLLAVRDIKDWPLYAETIMNRPYVRRGLTLFEGFDVKAKGHRRFYLEAIKGMELPKYRLGIFDPDRSFAKPAWESRDFDASVSDWRLMSNVISDLQKQGVGKLNMHVFPVAS